MPSGRAAQVSMRAFRARRSRYRFRRCVDFLRLSRFRMARRLRLGKSMGRSSGGSCRALAHLVLLAGALNAQSLTLQISNETVPAGVWAQIKIWAAAPQPVASGRILMALDSAVFGPI